MRYREPLFPFNQSIIINQTVDQSISRSIIKRTVILPHIQISIIMTSNDKIINPQTQMETSDLTRSQDSIEQSFFGLLICPSGASTNTSSGSSSSSSVSSIDNMNSMSFTDQDQTTTFESPLPMRYTRLTSPPPLFFSNRDSNMIDEQLLVNFIPIMSDNDEENNNDRRMNSNILLPLLREMDANRHPHPRMHIPQLMQRRSLGTKPYHFWKENDQCEDDATNMSMSGIRNSSSFRTGPENEEFFSL